MTIIRHVYETKSWVAQSQRDVPGIKFNYKRDCRIGFEKYVQAFKPQQIANTMHEGTDEAFSVLSTAKSVRFMCLRTFKPIFRTQ